MSSEQNDDQEQDPTEWARQMVARVQESGRQMTLRREELAEALEALVAGLRQIATEPWEGVNTSPAESDARAADVSLGDRHEAVQAIIKYEAAVNLLSAADQLTGWSLMMQAQRSLMGAVAVSRGVYEACVWASAVLDPSLTTEERLQRALSRRLARLAAGIRVAAMLHQDGAPPADAESFAGGEDEHGSHRDPAQDIDDIVAYATAQGWQVKKGRRSSEIGQPLTIDWLSENLERRLGIEGYAWASGASRQHGEHAADTASWVALSQSLGGTAPGWMIGYWSTGLYAGLRLLLASFAEYTEHAVLMQEFRRFERAFWHLDGKGLQPG